MKEVLELLKFGASQGTATIGAVTRVWLFVMGCMVTPVYALGIIGGVLADPKQTVIMISGGLVLAGVASVPVMLVLGIIHVARKW